MKMYKVQVIHQWTNKVRYEELFTDHDKATIFAAMADRIIGHDGIRVRIVECKTDDPDFNGLMSLL